MAKIKRLSAADQEEYDKLVAHAEQIQLDIDKLTHKPVILGYARVSSKGQAKDGNSLESQDAALRAAGAIEVYSDVYTGTSMDRPKLQELLAELQEGDTLVVTKLDRIARSVSEGVGLIEGLVKNGITVNVLNMGVLSNSPANKFQMQMMVAFAEFERDLIMERTRAGKEIARQKPGYKEGRPKKYTEAQIDHAVALLDEYSYTQVTEMTGISRATLIRAKAYAKKISEMKKS